VIQFGSYLEKLGNKVKIVCITHSSYKGWYGMSLNELGYISGTIQVNQQGEWIAQ